MLLAQDIESINKLAAAISASLNNDIPAAQIVRAVKRYDMSFFPIARSFSNTFSAVSELSPVKSINVDATYGLFLTEILGRQSSSDTNGYVDSIKINDGYDLLPEAFPFVYLTRMTGPPLDWNFFVPPVSQIQTQVRNGSTTAVATFEISYKGYKVPADAILKLTGKSSF